MKKKSQKSKGASLSRRDFLVKSGLGLVALDTIMGSLLTSQMASAQTIGSFKKFLNCHLFLAPPRWMFDLMLNPTGNASKFLSNPMVSNFYTSSISGGSYDNAIYKLVDYNGTGMHVPYLLGQNVHLAGGTTTKAWNLLNNMMQIRGINVIDAGHVGAFGLHQAGVIGQPTILSVLADRATRDSSNIAKNLIRAIMIDPSYPRYKSKEGSTAFRYVTKSPTLATPTSNNLTELFASMAPLNQVPGVTPAFLNTNAALKTKITAAMNALDPSSDYYYQQVLESSGSALKLLTDQSVETFSHLTQEWEPLYNKYLSAIQGTMGATYLGINDRRIGVMPTTDAVRRRYQFNTEGRYYLPLDGSGAVDLREMFKSVTVMQLAAQFAVVEFLMTRDICPSIQLMPSPFFGVAGAMMQFDQHRTGYMPGIYQNSMYFLSFTACMLELIKALKADGSFNDTLIYMASEFNRSARVTGSGSDHAFGGGHVNLISGRISQFKLVGNILKDSAGVGSAFDASYKGTWGHGAPIAGNKSLNIQTFWASIMVLLGTPLSEIPNVIDKTKMLFKTPGSFALESAYRGAPTNVVNASK